MGVPRGATPTITLSFPESSGINLTLARSVYVTFTRGQVTLTKTGVDLTIEPLSIGVFLTQAETLSFGIGDVEVQANWITADEKRVVSEIAVVGITKQLLDEVIT